jgi:tRNA A37 threonylcarbamoyladenosine modification protein TsaB
MIILAVYADLDVLSITLTNEESCLFNENLPIHEQTLTKILPETIKHVLGIHKPACIAFHKGPGGFTSLRVTAAFLQGLAFGYNCLIYAPCHFTVLKKALQRENGWIAIDNKGAQLPIVHIQNNNLGEIMFLDRVQCVERGMLNQDQKKINLAQILITMAKNNKHEWINPMDLIMHYGTLPNYKIVKKETFVD